MFNRLLYEVDLSILYPATIILIVGTAEFGALIGRRFPGVTVAEGYISTLTSAALGLLALLLAFSFSLALTRYDARRTMVLEEANAIGSTANFALMLPEPAQRPILILLRDYTSARIDLSVTSEPLAFQQGIARSLDLQTKLWQQAVAVTVASPQSLPAHRFVASLNEMNNIHERRLVALRSHVPGEVMFMLIGVAVVAMGITGFYGGIAGGWRAATGIMSVMLSVVLVIVVDLDRPTSGLIKVPFQPLVDAAQGIAP
jgi:hypothetical protein